MGEIVDLQQSQLAQLRDNQDFISDFARYSDGLLTEKFLRRKYNFSDEMWSRLGDDDSLVEKIEEEKLRRMRSGATKREKAQKHVLAAPDVAASIMNDVGANARHRLDACKVLDDFSATGPAAVPAADRFQITINLGADSDGRAIVEHYDKAIAIDVTDSGSDHSGTGPDNTVKPDDIGHRTRGKLLDKAWDYDGG